MFSDSKKNPRYFCDFCGHFRALLGFFFSRILLNLLFLRFLWYLSRVFLTRKKNPFVTFAILVMFAEISGPFLASLLWKSWMLLHLLFLRFLRYLSWVFSASKKNHTLRTFRGPSWLLFFLSPEFCYICHFCDLSHGYYELPRQILVTFAIIAIFADISGSFLASSFSKSWFLLDFIFLRFLRYLSWVFSASKKNPCYFCDFCGHFVVLPGFFFF